VMRLLVTIPLAMLCVACGKDKPVLILPPIELTTCAAEPLAPDLPGREFQTERDELTFEYVLAIRAAWGDCAAKVDGLRTWRETASE
jgi:hypothetical protein